MSSWNLEREKGGSVKHPKNTESFPWIFFPLFSLSKFQKILPAFLLSLALPHSAFADGGAVLSQQIAGPYRVTLFASPSPLRAGPADFSVMLQDSKTGAPVLDQSVAIKVRATVDPKSEAWTPPCCSMKSRSETTDATHANAQNKLLYAANVILPSSGPRDLIVNIGGEGGEFIEAKIDVKPPLAPVTSYWTWLAAPPLLIGIFALNARLRRRI